MLELTVSEDQAGQRLDKYVRKALKDVPLSHIYKMFRTKKVRVNNARGRAEQVLVAGDRIVIRGNEEKLLATVEGEPGKPRPVRITFRVLYEDEHILAVDKPAGLAAHPGTGISGATMVEEARAYLKTPDDLPPNTFKPSPAHRLDRDTSGVMLVAKTRQAMVRLTEIFTEKKKSEVTKAYLALAKGKLPRDKGTIDEPLSEHEQTGKSRAMRGVKMQDARTRYRVIASIKEATLLALEIETGRTHQIRRHLEAIGHPVIGDRRYGDFPFNRLAQQKWACKRMFLHAWKLTMPHPITGKRLALTAELPAELTAVLDRMSLSLPTFAT